MIKILHIITDSNVGGAGRQLIALVNAMDKDNFDIEVILPQGGKLIPELNKNGIRYTEARGIADRSFSWAGVSELKRIIKKKTPDIVHTHASLSGRLAARLAAWPTASRPAASRPAAKCKTVHTRHSVFPKRGVKILSGIVNNALSDAMIAVSPAAQQNLLEEGAKAKKIRVIYNGIPAVKELSEENKAELRKKYNVPVDVFVIAQLARLTEVKGQMYVLEAARMLSPKDGGGKFLFLLAGDGESKEILEKKIEIEKINNVRLLGFVSESDEIINLMDVQINASHGTEATSISLLEGMSAGKPAVATDYGGNPYVISNDKNGILIPCRSPEDILDAVVTLKNDTELYKKLCVGARKEFAERFTDREMARRTGELYMEMVHFNPKEKI